MFSESRLNFCSNKLIPRKRGQRHGKKEQHHRKKEQHHRKKYWSEIHVKEFGFGKKRMIGNTGHRKERIQNTREHGLRMRELIGSTKDLAIRAKVHGHRMRELFGNMNVLALHVKEYEFQKMIQKRRMMEQIAKKQRLNE